MIRNWWRSRTRRARVNRPVLCLEAFEDRLLLDGRGGLEPVRIDLQSLVNPTVRGQDAVFVAIVSPKDGAGTTPTGTVEFRRDGIDLGAAPLEAGRAQIDTDELTVGVHVITAHYGGDEDYASGVSEGLAHSVVRAETSTRLEASARQAMFGQPVTLTAAVTVLGEGSGAFSGTVTFRAGGVVLGTATVGEGGVAVLTVTNIPVGTASLTAVYGGNDELQGSTSATVGLQVSRARTASTLETHPNPVGYGQPVTIIVHVWAEAPSTATPVGTVVLREGSTVLGTSQLVDGVVRFTLANLFVGGHALTARFEGSGNFLAVTSEETVVAIGSLNQRWVARAYLDLLGRVVDPGGLAAFTALLDQGMTHTDAALRIMRECGAGCEFFTHTVRNLYRQLLRREPDPAGLAGHVASLRTGAAIGDVKARLLGSAEYYANPLWGGGSNDAAWLAALYRDVLDRALATSERTFWLQVMQQGATRELVALVVVRSTESLARVVNLHIVRLLGRQGTSEEHAAAVAQMRSGRREEEIIAVIAGSAEYLGNL